VFCVRLGNVKHESTYNLGSNNAPEIHSI